MKLKLEKNDKELKESFFSMTTPEQLAELLEIPYKVLNYYLYILPIKEQYKIFNIKKKNGGERKICSPKSSINIIQKKLKHILQLVYKVNYSAHGFILNRSIKTNAKKHTNKEYVLNIDLANFFPSITYRRVYGLFCKYPYSFPKGVASRLAALCCYKEKKIDEGFLPQGAPTSPVVSNMICWRMDNNLYKLGKKYNCRYTRYADDITFSTNELEFPCNIAIVTEQNSKRNLRVEVGNELNNIIKDMRC
jgi:RNA-directed DNA polymerase